MQTGLGDCSVESKPRLNPHSHRSIETYVEVEENKTTAHTFLVPMSYLLTSPNLGSMSVSTQLSQSLKDTKNFYYLRDTEQTNQLAVLTTKERLWVSHYHFCLTD